MRPSLCDILAGHGTDKNTGHAYGPVYEDLLAPVRDTARTVLEIGVAGGGSLRSWRDYFENARIVGLDCDPSRMFTDDRIATVLGNQSDPAFLRSVGVRQGPFDFICDDGSHKPGHQFTSLLYLWEWLRPGGIYVIEDIQDATPLVPYIGQHFVDLRPQTGVYDDVLMVLHKD